MYRTENQFNTTASELAIEEVYTNLDIEPNDLYIHNEGFTFRYPQRWLNDPSQHKAIGLRRLNITPPRLTFKLKFTYILDDTEKDLFQIIDVLPGNNVSEILTYIRNFLSEKLSNKDNSFNLDWTFTGTKLALKFYKNTDSLKFKFRGETNDDTVSVLKLFNQEITDDAIKKLDELQNEFVFNNVWDRDYIEFHASFSEARKGFLGLRNEFYNKPSLLFKSPHDGPTFHITFYTNNARIAVLPRHCRFIIQLCFIFNYKKTMIL